MTLFCHPAEYPRPVPTLGCVLGRMVYTIVAAFVNSLRVTLTHTIHLCVGWWVPVSGGGTG